MPSLGMELLTLTYMRTFRERCIFISSGVGDDGGTFSLDACRGYGVYPSVQLSERVRKVETNRMHPSSAGTDENGGGGVKRK